MASKDLFIEAQDLFAQGHPQESIELFTKARKAGFEPIITSLSRGAAYVQVHNFEKAIEDFSDVLKLDPDNERALYYRGLSYLNKGEFELAAADLNKAVALNPKRGAAFLALGLAHSELGREEEAAADLKNAVARSTVEVEGFGNFFGMTRTLFDKSMALLEGDRGPWKMVLTEEEINKLKKWLEK